MAEQANPYVLPSNVKPLKYQLFLEPDFEKFTFRGNELILVNVLLPTREIVLNAAKLTIARADFLRSGMGFQAEEIICDEKLQQVRLVFPTELAPGLGHLEISFSGTLNDRLVGFYRSTYELPDGTKRTMAATQFESTDARQAFPCWDEPAIKARFRLSLGIPRELTAISNMPVAEETEITPKAKLVRFEETPIMSTYLLAFMVGEFECVEERAPSGTAVRVWTTPGKREQGRFALDIAVKVLEYFTEYFGIPYPLPKLDHIAIPDFSAGAMENWGAITYRENTLLIDDAESSQASRQRVAETVAHEIAHQWFGNLVTMKWWDNLWLNESFATWIGTKAVAHLFPDWDMWPQFVSHEMNEGLRLDGLANSHPIEVLVKDPDEVAEIFDEISYDKGGAVLRMLEAHVGEKNFRDGLRLYLARHQYGNAQTEDLWQALEEASGQPVLAMMNSWVKQTGYPVLTVTRDEDILTVAQGRFLYDGETDETLWQIPLTLATDASDAPQKELFGSVCTQIVLQGPPSWWVLANAGRTGFYRVDYGVDGWSRLLPPLREGRLPTVDRLGLVSDAYAFCRAGHVSAAQFLALATACRGETEYVVWNDLAEHVREMLMLLEGEPCYGSFVRFARELVTPTAIRLGWDPQGAMERHTDILLRALTLSDAGLYGNPEILEEAWRRFDSFRTDSASLRPDIRLAVLANAARVGGSETFDALTELYRAATLQEEKTRIATALGAFRDPSLLQRALEFNFSPDVRVGDAIYGVVAVCRNPSGKLPVWAFVKERWDEIRKRYEGMPRLSWFVAYATRHFASHARAAEVQEFFRTHDAPGAERAVKQAVETIGVNAEWLGANRHSLAEWFQGR